MELRQTKFTLHCPENSSGHSQLGKTDSKTLHGFPSNLRGAQKAIFSENPYPEVLFGETWRRMLTLHNASLLKAQCGIVGMNHTTHLDPSSSALRVSDALFISLEAQSQQTEIAVISGSPKKLRKQSEKSSFGLLGHLRLHICIYRLKGQGPT
jgi:hypothetical protein